MWFAPPPESEWIPFRVPLLFERAAELSERLRQQEIEPRSWFLSPASTALLSDLVRRQVAGESLEEVFPNAAMAYERGILLPVHATLSEEQIDHVCRTIREFYGAR